MVGMKAWGVVSSWVASNERESGPAQQCWAGQMSRGTAVHMGSGKAGLRIRNMGPALGPGQRPQTLLCWWGWEEIHMLTSQLHDSLNKHLKVSKGDFRGHRKAFWSRDGVISSIQHLGLTPTPCPRAKGQNEGGRMGGVYVPSAQPAVGVGICTRLWGTQSCHQRPETRTGGPDSSSGPWGLWAVHSSPGWAPVQDCNLAGRRGLHTPS